MLQTRIKNTNLQRAITQNVLKVEFFLMHCTSSLCPASLYLVSFSSLKLLLSYALDMKMVMDGQTDRQTDKQTDKTVRLLYERKGGA